MNHQVISQSNREQEQVASEFPNRMLEGIYATRRVADEAGNDIELTSHIDLEEGKLLHSLVEQQGFCRALEIGCAFGVSSLWICDALSRQKAPQHTIIDPYQSTQWSGVGVANLRRAGFDFVDLIEKRSELALPGLVEKGSHFQFAFIDGWHTFDHALLDFFYINQLLEEGGIVVIDDVDMPSIRKVVRYILRYPSYRLVATTKNSLPLRRGRRRVGDALLRSLAALMPETHKRQVFADSWERSDYSLGINCTMVALQKTGPDTRSWNWYEPF